VWAAPGDTDGRIHTLEVGMTSEGTRPTAGSIAPWLSVADAGAAVGFYRAAFGAVELERLEDAGRVVVAQLAIGGADFWVQEDPEGDPHALGDRSPVRMILSVDDPDAVFARAVAAGALQVVPVSEDHGWRVGRVADPSGHHWEVGRRLER
jgi:PhnB protein